MKRFKDRILSDDFVWGVYAIHCNHNGNSSCNFHHWLYHLWYYAFGKSHFVIHNLFHSWQWLDIFAKCSKYTSHLNITWQ